MSSSCIYNFENKFLKKSLFKVSYLYLIGFGVQETCTSISVFFLILKTFTKNQTPSENHNLPWQGHLRHLNDLKFMQQCLLTLFSFVMKRHNLTEQILYLWRYYIYNNFSDMLSIKVYFLITFLKKNIFLMLHRGYT